MDTDTLEIKRLRYMVLFAGFVISFLELGTLKSMGVFLIPIQKSFETTNAALGPWMASCQAAANILAPAVIHTVQTFGERPVTICGGVLCSCSLVMASFVNCVSWFGILMIIAGLGYSMTYYSSLAVIPKLFPTNANSVVGFMGAGGALGMMVCPPMIEFFIEQYGWKGAMLVLGAINANNIVCGVMIRPFSEKCFAGYIRVADQMDSSARSANEHVREPFLKSFWSWVRNVLSKMFKRITFLFIDNPKFIPFPIYAMNSGIALAGWAIFLVPHAVVKGISTQLATILSTTGGLGFMIGRLILGPLVQCDHITSIQFLIILPLINAIAFFADHFFVNFWILSCLSFVNGFALGAQTLAPYAGAEDILGKDKAVEATSVGGIFYSVGNIIGGYLIGQHLDEESSSSFTVLAVICALGAIIMTGSTDTFEKISLAFRKPSANDEQID